MTWGRKSRCDAFREAICAKVNGGLSAQRIYQDLVEENGFRGSYQSVKRFVARLKEKHPERVYRMECEPGEENRWQIELFFKWIKQNLRIKAFYGTNPNAVRSQIWIAICVYLMVAIVKKQHGIEESREALDAHLRGGGFERVGETENFARYSHPSDFVPDVDVLFVDASTFDKLHVGDILLKFSRLLGA